MKTVFVAYRVTDPDRSLGFHTSLGNVELGRQEKQFTDEGRLLDCGQEVLLDTGGVRARRGL
ncbi:hypothetical protein [Streptomyces sp. NPDC059928]|uniref:hypothetical protein n=1 Tax=unclassified Streptomyces TaxID=2593676 RepID=UPI0036617C80